MGNYKHGMRYTRIYRIWRSMRQRCNNKNTNRYPVYGGKGIKVCDEWNNDFLSFYNWSMRNGYTETLTIDRIDANGDYEPNNCRWVTQKTQQNNRTNNRYIEYNGEKHTIAEWADISGISSRLIWSRLKMGWNVEKTLTIKPTKRNA